ncbi:pyridoxal phosphate-dependent aminotransferase [Hoeflea ulvae]|uniref:aspartate transaminase n=1 Tax=Hoeflea ulvae TaxID=2983764 RepID=A0ABT3YDN3_9HYPH|nr:pyridoxal phosphate-dependent aminotransferase [Hoeflea ulvae]MCY0093988.1 pyridoxal phosphate-dependent aminotransferase [Hoeflea ulvae]
MHYAAITDRLAHTGGAKWAIHQRCREMKAAGADIIELTIGEPDLPPDPRLFEICHQSMLAGRTGYSSGRGEPALLEAIAARYAKRRAGVDTNNVLCFPGTQTALFATMMALTGPGDGVLVGDPFYATYEGVIVASGAHRQSVPLRPEHGFRMTAEDLEASITPHSRVLLLNSPHNPTGAVLEAGELAKIGAVCKKHDLWIVADEVYEELVFDGDFASPFDNPDLAERVIAVSSISKSHAAPGFRSGWAVGPHEFCEKLLPFSETMLFGNQPFIADMTAFALTSDMQTSALMRESYKRRSGVFADRLEKLDGIVPFRPQAGMFIVLDVSGTGLDGETFAWRLLEAGVAVMPGSSFGDSGGKLVRLSLTVPDEAVEEACRRIARFVGTI